MNNSAIYKVSDNEFKEIIKNNISYSDCLRAFGLTPKGGSSTDVLKRRINELNCSTNHFCRTAKQKANSYSLEEILTINSKFSNNTILKKKLIKENLLDYKCRICGISDWQGKTLMLHLDHINGINNDNRIENLRFLCPNCHSQTETYAGKNIKKKNKILNKYVCKYCGKEFERDKTKGRNQQYKYCSIKCCNDDKKQNSIFKSKNISKEILLSVIYASGGNFIEVGKYFKVSDNIIRRWCKYFNIPHSSILYRKAIKENRDVV